MSVMLGKGKKQTQYKGRKLNLFGKILPIFFDSQMEWLCFRIQIGLPHQIKIQYLVNFLHHNVTQAPCGLYN